MMFGKRIVLALTVLAGQFSGVTAALSLTVGSKGVNASSDLLMGILYEDIYHSGDGGLYAELIRNRAFQGSNKNGRASTDRNTDYWHAYGGASLSIDTSSPALSGALPFQMRMDVPAGTKGKVGFYNDGFWGFDVDSAKRYVASFYMRGDYSGSVNFYFKNYISNTQVGNTNANINQQASAGWRQIWSPTFQPSQSTSNPNNTFYLEFDGAALAGKSVYFNLFSLFKQTYNNRVNGLREDLVQGLQGLGGKFLRMPGGNNMEGDYSPYYWKWNLTIGDLTTRPGRPGTWGDVNTDGFGLLEQLQLGLDLNMTIVLGVWAGLYLDGEVIPQSQLQPYVTEVMNELSFLLDDKSTTYGALRASLGYPDPFTNIKYVEIGNEDFLAGGTDSYYQYRFNAYYNAIKAKYPRLTTVSTINPSPNNAKGEAIDLHIYGNEAYFKSLFNTFDQASRNYPVFVAEYAATNTGSNNDGQVGAQTMGMAMGEAIFLLGCERNSDVIVGTSYGALIKEYNEEPGTVAAIKHTADDILYTISFYVQQLFANYKGSQTAQVTASGGKYDPVYWSATKSSTQTILKLVNYNGPTGNGNAVRVTVQGSTANRATVIRLTAPSVNSVNNLAGLGGEASKVTTSTISGSNGVFSVPFTGAYEFVVLVV